jgi:hypothetical protein
VKAPSQNIGKLNILKAFGALKPTSTNDLRCRDSMVIVFTTTYVIRAYHRLSKLFRQYVFVFFILLYFFPHFIEYVLIVIYKQGGCGHCHMVVSYLLRLPI